MFRLLSFATLALMAAGCTTYKLWTVADSDRETATVSLYYEYRKFENPQTDELAAVQMARGQCRDWGYPGAHRKGEERKCIAGEEPKCTRWRVIREYRCNQPEK